ncbi:hypothetical protein CAAN1_25S01090 [[Candida] anglica]|uniref:NADH dehydrogenase [ubiquinone] iron-sulfur protein 5 n=1 Tax=[Candida] anglica TaxID=148631 RepID=A0ABP0EES5_9ASCO
MQPYSRSGGTRRCFYEFQTFMECYTNADTKTTKECTPVFNDYYECLHGVKEREKARLMLQQLRDNEATKNGVTAAQLFKSSGNVYENLDLVK